MIDNSMASLRGGRGTGGCESHLATRWCAWAIVASLAVASIDCTAVQRVPKREDSARAFLQLNVEPKQAEIYIDGSYKGRVEGWARGVVPLEPGGHRLKLTADGYMTQRFDIHLDQGETKRLQLVMEPNLEDLSSD